MLEQSGRALQVAHARRLVHRDIKPGNILITPAGQVKITDFGIAKVAHQVPVTRSGMVMGTAQYLSPEQAAGGEALPASDVYALGVVAYECLAGRRPFERDSPIGVATAHVQDPVPPLPADIPPPVAALVMRMLAKIPADRFPDGASLAAACAAVRTGAAMPPTGAHPIRVPTAAAPIGYRPRPRWRGGRFPDPAATAAIAAAPRASPACGPADRPDPARAVGGDPIGPGSALCDPEAGSPPSKRTWLAVLIVLVVLLLTAVAAVFLVIKANAAPGDAGAGHRRGSRGCQARHRWSRRDRIVTFRWQCRDRSLDLQESRAAD